MMGFLFSLLAQANFGGGFNPPTEAYSARSPESDQFATANAEKFLSTLIGFLTLVGSLFFVFHFILGALNWITAGGEQGKVQKARDKMTQGIIGLVVLVASYSLLGIIGNVLGLKLLEPGAVVRSLKP
jgi:hypothetical protein